MSSSPPPLARDHAQRFATRDIGYLDAPVSGGVVGARAGTLAIMAGGSAADFARAKPIFEALGRPTLVGPPAAANSPNAATRRLSPSPSARLPRRCCSPRRAAPIPSRCAKRCMGGFADSRILQLHGKRMIERDFLPGGRARVQLKDQDTILAAAKAAKLQLPLSECVTALYRDLVNQGGSELDQNALLLQLERINAPARLGQAADKFPHVNRSSANAITILPQHGPNFFSCSQATINRRREEQMQYRCYFLARAASSSAPIRSCRRAIAMRLLQRGDFSRSAPMLGAMNCSKAPALSQRRSFRASRVPDWGRRAPLKRGRSQLRFPSD